MGVTLERVQFKFASIIGELCSEPDILSQFAVWVDLRLAEYKLKGSISLDCSGDTPDPIWLKGILSALLEKRLTALKSADQHIGRGVVGNPMFHSTPITQRVGSAGLKQEATDEAADIFPVGFHAHRNTDNAPYSSYDFRKRRACETVTRHDSNSAYPAKMRRVENTKDDPIVISHESLMSVLNPRDSEDGATVPGNTDPSNSEHTTEISLSSDVDTTLHHRESYENDGSVRLPVADLNAMPAPSDIELPTLSPVCLALLRKSDSRSMGHLVREAAAYYHHYYPQMKDRAYYAAVGRKLVEKYPCLSYPGNNPWSVLIGKLSQKMRLLRLREKAEREKDVFGTSTLSQKAISVATIKLNVTASHEEAEKKSLERHVESLERLRELWNQSDPDRAVVKEIMSSTWHHRRTWLTRNKPLTIKTIQTMYPCFEDVEFILDDFYYSMGPRDEAADNIMKKLRNMFSKTEKLISRRLKHEDDVNEASDAVLALEKLIARTKGKGGKSESILQIVEIEDCTEDLDVWASGLAGDDAQPPSLIVFIMGGEYLQSFVVGGGVAIDARAATLFEALVVVLAVYTVFCVDFPHKYCQLLGLLQECLTGKVYTGAKTLGYLQVLKALQSDS